MILEYFDDLKKSAFPSEPLYKLRNANVYVASSGFHFTRHFDGLIPIEENDELDHAEDQTDEYIRSQLQANVERYEHQLELLRNHVELSSCNLLDIGCGGGYFLNLAKEAGAKVTGLELSQMRARFAENEYGLAIHRSTIEDPVVLEEWKRAFNVVTLWDVLEHVNYPNKTVNSIGKVLAKDGLICIDTPCRDSFYHKVGEISYRITRGKYPLFLNIMYSDHPYGHKQIFSTGELVELLNSADFEVVYLKKFHELSFPIEFYLSKLFMSKKLGKFFSPFANLFFKCFPVKNKVAVIARKK